MLPTGSGRSRKGATHQPDDRHQQPGIPPGKRLLLRTIVTLQTADGTAAIRVDLSPDGMLVHNWIRKDVK